MEIEAIEEIEKLRAALQLARDMMIANDLYLPHTMEVIDDALKIGLESEIND